MQGVARVLAVWSVFVFDILQIPSGCVQICWGVHCAHMQPPGCGSVLDAWCRYVQGSAPCFNVRTKGIFLQLGVSVVHLKVTPNFLVNSNSNVVVWLAVVATLVSLTQCPEMLYNGIRKIHNLFGAFFRTTGV